LRCKRFDAYFDLFRYHLQFNWLRTISLASDRQSNLIYDQVLIFLDITTY